MTIKVSIMISSHSTYSTVDWLANWKLNIASLMVANKPYLITSKQVVVVHLYLISKINMSNLRNVWHKYQAATWGLATSNFPLSFLASDAIPHAVISFILLCLGMTWFQAAATCPWLLCPTGQQCRCVNFVTLGGEWLSVTYTIKMWYR